MPALSAPSLACCIDGRRHGCQVSIKLPLAEFSEKVRRWGHDLLFVLLPLPPLPLLYHFVPCLVTIYHCLPTITTAIT